MIQYLDTYWKNARSFGSSNPRISVHVTIGANLSMVLVILSYVAAHRIYIKVESIPTERSGERRAFLLIAGTINLKSLSGKLESYRRREYQREILGSYDSRSVQSFV